MNDKLDYLISKVDKISDDVAEIAKQDAVQNQQLAEHMRRSDLLEQRVEQVSLELSPIKSHVDMVKGALKLLAGVGAFISALGVIWKLLGK